MVCLMIIAIMVARVSILDLDYYGVQHHLSRSWTIVNLRQGPEALVRGPIRLGENTFGILIMGVNS